MNYFFPLGLPPDWMLLEASGLDGVIRTLRIIGGCPGKGLAVGIIAYTSGSPLIVPPVLYIVVFFFFFPDILFI
jgi:hypothetical protein